MTHLGHFLHPEALCSKSHRPGQFLPSRASRRRLRPEPMVFLMDYWWFWEARIARLDTFASKVQKLMDLTTLCPKGSKVAVGRPGASRIIKKALHLVCLLPRAPQRCTLAPKVQKENICDKSALLTQKCSLASQGHNRQGVYSYPSTPSAHSEVRRRVHQLLVFVFLWKLLPSQRKRANWKKFHRRVTLDFLLLPPPGIAYRDNVFGWF